MCTGTNIATAYEEYKTLGLIDSRNEDLFIQIRDEKKCIVNLMRCEKIPECWSMRMHNDNGPTRASIYMDKEENNICSFTHELLHVAEELKTDINVSHLALDFEVAYYYNDFLEFNKIFPLTKNMIIIDIDNIILHVRMFENYKNMGFPYKNFIAGYDDDIDFPDNHNQVSVFILYFLGYKLHQNPKIQRELDKFINYYNIREKMFLVEALKLLSDRWENKEIIGTKLFFKYMFEIVENWKKRLASAA